MVHIIYICIFSVLGVIYMANFASLGVFYILMYAKIRLMVGKRYVIDKSFCYSM